MDTILDTHYQPWRSHVVAQVVVGVGGQAKVTIHQRHQGQGRSPGRQGQLLQAGGRGGGSPGTHPRPEASAPLSPAPQPQALPGTCCPDNGC